MPKGDPSRAVYNPVPPASVVEDARRRASLDRTANMTVLGDPPPGRSELDRRREQSEPPAQKGLRRFSAEDVAVIRDLVAKGHGAGFIAMRLDREPGAVRSKLSAMGLPIRPRAKPTYGSRFQISRDIFDLIERAASKRKMTPTKLSHGTLARIAKLDLWDCVNDVPEVERKPAPVPARPSPEPEVEPERSPAPLPISVMAFAPTLEGRVN